MHAGAGPDAGPPMQPLPTSHNLSAVHLLPQGYPSPHGCTSPHRAPLVAELEPSRVRQEALELHRGPRLASSRGESRRESRESSPKGFAARRLEPAEPPSLQHWQSVGDLESRESSPKLRQRTDRSSSQLQPDGLETWCQNLSLRQPNVRSEPADLQPAGERMELGGSFASSSSQPWNTDRQTDPKANLMRILDPFLPSNPSVREQVSSLVAKTILSVEAAASANIEKDRLRAEDAEQVAKQELLAVQEELQTTEQNRSELAALLAATIHRTQAAMRGPEPVDPQQVRVAALIIQRAWRRLRSHWRRRRSRPSDAYDVIVCFDSLNSMIDPRQMRVDILQWAHSAFNIAEPDRQGLRIVAHLGLFDKGKTFLINQFYGKKLPSGKLHETTGLSMIHIPKLRFLVIDTKGLQAPVSYKSKGVKQLVDASQTEIFLFELVSRLAHYIIFVVNDFTWPEQRDIVQLHQKYVQSKRENQLIVAHNLRTTRSVHEAVELFWKQVASKYEGVERNELGGLIFTVDQKPRIHHIGFAEEHSPAGKKFNTKNTAHLLQLLDQLEGVGERQRSVAELLQEHFTTLLPEFVFLESTSGERLEGSGLRVMAEINACGTTARQLEPDEESDPALYRSIGVLELQVSEGSRVCMKTEGVFSEFCELVAQDITFKPPPPNVYEQRLKDKLVRLVEFEIPGVTRRDICFKRGNRGYTVTMSRTRDKGLGNYSVAPRFPAPRMPIGEFSFDLFFDDGIWELDGGREAVTHENGLLRVRLKQDLDGHSFTLDSL
mmetsp:Transcript_91425/g.258901  ORF Transcript_91425/g.258901 Transcript_91425/m.258901 type:complete len:777 (+) Transcript_91425:32-2362(+)